MIKQKEWILKVGVQEHGLFDNNAKNRKWGNIILLSRLQR